MPTFNNIAHFIELNISESGLVTLTLDFPQDENMTRVEFHISELRDWLYEMNTNVDENDEIIDICITDHNITKDIVVNCIEVTTQDNYKEQIYEDDDLFFTDLLKLDIE